MKGSFYSGIIFFLIVGINMPLLFIFIFWKMMVVDGKIFCLFLLVGG